LITLLKTTKEELGQFTLNSAKDEEPNVMLENTSIYIKAINKYLEEFQQSKEAITQDFEKNTEKLHDLQNRGEPEEMPMP
jgi:hypothetical protein